MFSRFSFTDNLNRLSASMFLRPDQDVYFSWKLKTKDFKDFDVFLFSSPKLVIFYIFPICRIKHFSFFSYRGKSLFSYLRIHRCSFRPRQYLVRIWKCQDSYCCYTVLHNKGVTVAAIFLGSRIIQKSIFHLPNFTRILL